MDRAKYIIYEDAVFGVPTPILFPTYCQHADMSERLGVKLDSIISAGFARLRRDGRLEAFGESLSLKKKSRDEDTDLLTKLIGGPTRSGYEQFADGLANKVIEQLAERAKEKE